MYPDSEPCPTAAAIEQPCLQRSRGNGRCSCGSSSDGENVNDGAARVPRPIIRATTTLSQRFEAAFAGFYAEIPSISNLITGQRSLVCYCMSGYPYVINGLGRHG